MPPVDVRGDLRNGALLRRDAGPRLPLRRVLHGDAAAAAAATPQPAAAASAAAAFPQPAAARALAKIFRSSASQAPLFFSHNPWLMGSLNCGCEEKGIWG